MKKENVIHVFQKSRRWICDKREAIRFYSVLVLTLAILGTAAYGYRNRGKEKSELPAMEEASMIVQTLPETSWLPEPEQEIWTKPVNGDIIGIFSMDELVWNEDLEQWQTHQGIDLGASIGEAVFAAADGTVIDSYCDSLYGNTIVVDHGDGCILRYASLNTLQLVKTGQRVRQGDVISAVGSCSAEASLGGHLHLECMVNEAFIDPSERFETGGNS